jgi:large subunit ribosomal protein L24
MPRKINQIPKLHIRKGDMVRVLSGDGKGKEGRVLKVLVSKQKALVEEINMVAKHNKPSQASPNGGIVRQEAPIHISNLMVIDPKSGQSSRIGRSRDENGRWVRIAKKSGQELK